ncbi:hypothetical protein [Planomonospora parontospora]|uniref:hypothetical protein n=1 Tax=Planomonospora parontospora TaxID=58119 RepID=UPI0016709DD3|nr:hypothetical protein [Planomonospora parontospora]GGL42537.1 hypothetical protein GCM10014719_49800 [Planomonospora parontospora subsp. antibiotica]GII18381.1 hypothetical protein Ppa05_51070 [Planomonospora parontospora subsp. antibiotica]
MDSSTSTAVPGGLDGQLLQAVTAARHAHEATAAELVGRVHQGQRLTVQHLYAAAYSQALRTWWNLVAVQTGKHGLDAACAIQKVRSWVRGHLTNGPGLPIPERLTDQVLAHTLFEHGLGHVRRVAARDFLADAGRLLLLAETPAAGTSEKEAAK